MSQSIVEAAEAAGETYDGILPAEILSEDYELSPIEYFSNLLPILDNDISGYLYDLLCGHEVGHALYTPEEGIRKALELKLSMSLMNVLEDSRIERKIKNKYPGIRASFVPVEVDAELIAEIDEAAAEVEF